MLLTVTFWVLVLLIIFWILLGPVMRFLRVLWEIIMQIYNKQTIDLRTKFGEWASKCEKFISLVFLIYNLIYKYYY